ncbi:formate dehydrogenase accessory sulfurtransferase FdhD [Halioglobus maricola]|uniref:Sulfur carrier protein FdhD n=1 Tax=Halioglobus maricola TaxID=2601894 RepID=A0A5P9NK53_9GAMM|nr:formate dehydrogenase accessory sulfurtransferase FdhD [Halioglobus maricola]QFU75624.1 formate dehydrogenase accessory sulfurtransferase FdhD [Halioglobus maricola]
MPETVRRLARQDWRAGQLNHDTDQVVVEVPVALAYNGISHAVLMATPCDLEDLALGFSLSESIIESPQQFLGVEILEREHGLELAIEITAQPFATLKGKRRNLSGRSGCGLCGKESLEALQLSAPCVPTTLSLAQEALQCAVDGLDGAQPLKALTGGVHGAAWCDTEGNILLLREDVGRHNALDKLLGAMRKRAAEPGFVLVSSRASYEMVLKAGTSGVELLAAVSAPTDLAVRSAQDLGMTLVAYLQGERHAVYCGGQRLKEG